MDNTDILEKKTYIELLNDFDNWLERNTMNRNAQLLYFRLLQLFNRFHWPDFVQMSNHLLADMICTSTEKTAIQARNDLIKAGFIEFKQGVRGYPSEYRLAKIEKLPF